MSDFINQFVPKGTYRNNAWAHKVFQAWAIKKGKTPDIKAYSESELAVELRKFYMDLSQSDGKLYTHVSLRGKQKSRQNIVPYLTL